MKASFFVAAYAACVALTGCQTTTIDIHLGGEDGGGGSGEGAGRGGDGGSGSGGADVTSTTSTTNTQPGTGPIRVGYGAYASPCGNAGSFVERPDDETQLGSIASKAIRLTSNPGWITRVAVVHVITDALGICDEEGRDVLLSKPTNLGVPMSPGLHAKLHFSPEDVLDAPIYDMPGIEYGLARILERDLDEPLHAGAVGEGDYVHVGSLFDQLSICQAACGLQVDGSLPPEGDSFCTVGESWSGCGVMPTPGSSGEFYLAYIAWVEVVPDEP